MRIMEVTIMEEVVVAVEGMTEVVEVVVGVVGVVASPEVEVVAVEGMTEVVEVVVVEGMIEVVEVVVVVVDVTMTKVQENRSMPLMRMISNFNRYSLINGRVLVGVRHTVKPVGQLVHCTGP